MDFSSLSFLFIFLPIFLSIYLLAKPEYRPVIIFLANISFIIEAQFSNLLWLAIITTTGYLTGRLIEFVLKNNGNPAVVVTAGIGLNLAILVFFKTMSTYGGYGAIKDYAHNAEDFSVPVGLSYIIFQILAYIIDISRNTIFAEKNLFKFASYILFFPKLISGPITKYKTFEQQIALLNPSTDEIANGIRQILKGVIKRVLVANQIGMVADAVFNLPSPSVSPFFAWLGLTAYTIQIYFDFSGYTDIALGLGTLIGIKLPQNFNYPYIAQSISDFWRRWHITMSSWFREYVFYPLERRRKFQMGNQQINLLVVFLLTGFWHGPTLNFLVWGGLHGLAIALESTSAGRWMKKLWPPVRHLYTITIVMLGWVFFRSPSINFAIHFISRLLGNTDNLIVLPFSQTSPLPFIEPSFIFILAAGILFSLPVTNLWCSFQRILEVKNSKLFVLSQLIADILIWSLFALSIAAQVSGSFRPNIYAQF